MDGYMLGGMSETIYNHVIVSSARATFPVEHLPTGSQRRLLRSHHEMTILRGALTL